MLLLMKVPQHVYIGGLLFLLRSNAVPWNHADTIQLQAACFNLLDAVPTAVRAALTASAGGTQQLDPRVCLDGQANVCTRDTNLTATVHISSLENFSLPLVFGDGTEATAFAWQPLPEALFPGRFCSGPAMRPREAILAFGGLRACVDFRLTCLGAPTVFELPCLDIGDETSSCTAASKCACLEHAECGWCSASAACTRMRPTPQHMERFSTVEAQCSCAAGLYTARSDPTGECAPRSPPPAPPREPPNPPGSSPAYPPYAEPFWLNGVRLGPTAELPLLVQWAAAALCGLASAFILLSGTLGGERAWCCTRPFVGEPITTSLVVVPATPDRPDPQRWAHREAVARANEAAIARLPVAIQFAAARALDRLQNSPAQAAAHTPIDASADGALDGAGGSARRGVRGSARGGSAEIADVPEGGARVLWIGQPLPLPYAAWTLTACLVLWTLYVLLLTSLTRAQQQRPLPTTFRFGALCLVLIPPALTLMIYAALRHARSTVYLLTTNATVCLSLSPLLPCGRATIRCVPYSRMIGQPVARLRRAACVLSCGASKCVDVAIVACDSPPRRPPPPSSSVKEGAMSAAAARLTSTVTRLLWRAEKAAGFACVPYAVRSPMLSVLLSRLEAVRAQHAGASAWGGEWACAASTSSEEVAVAGVANLSPSANEPPMVEMRHYAAATCLPPVPLDRLSSSTPQACGLSARMLDLGPSATERSERTSDTSGPGRAFSTARSLLSDFSPAVGSGSAPQASSPPPADGGMAAYA